jgi:hypothetical protein
MYPAYQSTMITQTLQPPQAPPSLSMRPQEAQSSRSSWPEPVKGYVRRSFDPDFVIPNIPRQEMEIKLKQVITEAAESGQLALIDWTVYPLPQQIIQQERFQAAHNYSYQPAFTSTNPSLVLKDDSPPSGKKRKHQLEHPATSDPANPPWRVKSFGDRVTYSNKGQTEQPEKRSKKDGEVSRKFQDDLDKRKRRFDQAKSSTPHHSFDPADDQNVRTSGPVVGVSEDLEKGYFRLTRQPRPHEVRPQPVLEKALEQLKKKWRSGADYSYIGDQLKAIRQDLYVQHIKNSFTAKVYELHARIALEKGDLGEYNQCQTQLRALYAMKIEGNSSEFLAYRILYFIHTANRIELNTVLAELTPAEKDTTAVKHALETRAAVASGNYHRLFRLYLNVPNMGGYLMDMFIERERLIALSKITLL